MKTFKEFIAEVWGGDEDRYEGSPADTHAAMTASASSHRYSGKGHYVKKDGKYLSGKHDSEDSAVKHWKSLPDHQKQGSKIVKEDFHED